MSNSALPHLAFYRFPILHDLELRKHSFYIPLSLTSREQGGIRDKKPMIYERGKNGVFTIPTWQGRTA